MVEPTSILAICDACGHTHIVRELCQLDGEPTGSLCPSCSGGLLVSVPEPLTGELARLYAVEGAARGWLEAYQVERAAQEGNVFKRDRLLPRGQASALRKLAAALAA